MSEKFRIKRKKIYPNGDVGFLLNIGMEVNNIQAQNLIVEGRILNAIIVNSPIFMIDKMNKYL